MPALETAPGLPALIDENSKLVRKQGLPKKNFPVPLTAALMRASLSLGHLATGLLGWVSLLLDKGTRPPLMSQAAEGDIGIYWR
jgi:hypothetical protein